MAAPGIQISRLRGVLDAEALGARKLSLTIQGCVLRLGEAALDRLLPPEKSPARLERVTNGRLELRGAWKGLAFTLEVVPQATPQGLARLEIWSVRAAGILPIPDFVIRMLLQKAVRPGVTLRGSRTLEIDLAALLRPLGIHLAPLRAVRAANGVLELEF